MKPEKHVMKGLVMVTQIGISVLVPIFLCVFVGRWIDRICNIQFATIIGIVLGIITAFRNIYKLTKQFYAADKQKEDEYLKYIEDMKREREDKLKKN